MDNQLLLEINGMEKKINDNKSIHIDNLYINKGDFVTIQGPSGIGKTTLLNIIGMNISYDKGSFKYNNLEVNLLSRKQKLLIKRNYISFIFQNFGLIEDEDINFNLDIGLKYSKINKNDSLEKKINALTDVNIDKSLDTPIKTLSGGEKQRIALARIILKPSQVILADEPTGSLDSKNSEIVSNILINQANEGKAVVIVTHNDFLANIGNKKIVL